MKKSILIALSLLLSFGTVDMSAQSFMKQLGNTIKKEVGNQVKKEVKKAVNEGIKQATTTTTTTKTTTTTTTSTVAATKPITKMNTWSLKIRDGKPVYGYNGDPTALKEPYYLYDLQFSDPDGVKPFMLTTAVATFKAREGYHFDKSLKLNEYQDQAETTTGFKIVDKQTVKVNLTAFTWGMEEDIRITPEMKAYKEKVSKLNLTEIATAKLYTPLYDHWYKKHQRRDFQHNELYVQKFIDKNHRAYYAYPTTEERFDKDGKYVKGASKENIGPDMTILSVSILDDDLSDDIPGLVGEWCLISKNRFIPKAFLKDIKYGNRYGDAPGKITNSAFEFAGGTGTLEDPFLVQTAEQLNAIRKGPNYHYKLIADIDLSKWGNWVPIGGTEAYGFIGKWNKADQGAFGFGGSLDGNGHVISGMQIIINEETPFLTESGNFRAYGLFGNLNTAPRTHQIKNLGVVNFNISVSYTKVQKEMYLYAAGICGGMNRGMDIYNCYTRGGKIHINLIGDPKYGELDALGMRVHESPLVHVHAGGICADGGGAFLPDAPRGRLEFIHIENTFNASDIEVEINNLDYMAYGAGIMGAMGETHIHNCYNSGNITLPINYNLFNLSSMDSYASGIASFAYVREIPQIFHWGTEATSFIQNCYNSGQIVGNGAAGIHFLSLADIHIENCYNSGTIIGNEFSQANDGCSINPTVGKACAIIPYGTEYVRNTTTNGNAVTGSMWKTSSTLGRKVLAAIPEDTHPSKKYEPTPVKVGNFDDVNAVKWYAKGVQWALDKNIISDESGKFSPDKNCTKADFYTFIWTAAGSPQPSGANPFSDVKASDSYYNAALWAHEKGMISGSSFAPQSNITRGEFVVSLWKSMGCPEGIAVNQYQEVTSHQSDFGRAMAWSHVNAVMGGTDRYKFSPEKSCTRGEAVTYIYRALK